jgi:hypothetical protein
VADLKVDWRLPSILAQCFASHKRRGKTHRIRLLRSQSFDQDRACTCSFIIMSNGERSKEDDYGVGVVDETG